MITDQQIYQAIHEYLQKLEEEEQSSPLDMESMIANFATAEKHQWEKIIWPLPLDILI